MNKMTIYNSKIYLLAYIAQYLNVNSAKRELPQGTSTIKKITTKNQIHTILKTI